MFERFTDSARRIIFFARDQALASREGMIKPDHLLLGLIQLHPELFEGVLHSANAVYLCREVESRCEAPKECPNPTDPRFTSELKRVLRNADDEASRQYKRDTSISSRLLGF